jgi:pilus assembly protein TadC
MIPNLPGYIALASIAAFVASLVAWLIAEWRYSAVKRIGAGAAMCIALIIIIITIPSIVSRSAAKQIKSRQLEINHQLIKLIDNGNADEARSMLSQLNASLASPGAVVLGDILYALDKMQIEGRIQSRSATPGKQ